MFYSRAIAASRERRAAAQTQPDQQGVTGSQETKKQL